jgi:hypothetical protein
MLFVIAMEVLGGLIRWADEQTLLSPIGCSAVRSRVSLYADDVVLFIMPKQRDFAACKSILRIFGDASGLYTNLEKSVATPIACSTEELELVAVSLSCAIGSFPCKYLGIPLSTRKLRRSEEQFIIDAVAARIPLWKGNLLNTAGRVTLVQSTLSAIPVHLSIAVCLSPWAIQRIDKLRRAFIWSGSDTVGAGKCRVAWELVCRPKDLGGLGIIDLRRLGVALRLRWDWLRKYDPSRTWVNLPSSTDKVSQALFRASTLPVLGDGSRTLFWRDQWIHGLSVQQIAPAVFAAVPTAKARSRTVASGLTNRAWVSDIAGAPTVQVVLQYLELWERVLSVQLVPGTPDSVVWRWSSDCKYSAASAYGAMFLGSVKPFGASLIWNSRAPARVRLFFWLALHRRCWTAERRRRHGLQVDDNCIMCLQVTETLDHILLGCVFSREVWERLLSRIGLAQLVITGDLDIFLWWSRSRRWVPRVCRKGFDSFVMLTCWMLWKERNARMFNNLSTVAREVAVKIVQEAELWIRSGISCLSSLQSLT